jgi:DNA-binding transcriptional regulator GbsR (MarR family)
MSDSTPNSPSEFFANLPPEKQLLNNIETEIQYIKQLQEEVSDAKDDNLFEISIGEYRAMLGAWLNASENAKAWVQDAVKLKKLFGR